MPFGNSYPVIELDSRNVNEVEVAPIILSQGDSSGRIIRYALWDGQDAMSGTGLSARFCIDQDEGLYAAMTAVAGASTATFQVAVPMGGVEAGWHAGCIRVSDSGGRVINTRLFKVYVEKSAIGSSAEQITAYADIISGAEDATTAATTAATAANNAAASAIAASGNRLTATLDGTGATPDTASDAWTGPLIGATVDGLSTQDGTPTPTVPVAIKSVEGAAAVVAGRNLISVSDYTRTMTNSYFFDVARNNTDLSEYHLIPGETYTLSVDVTSTVEPFNISVGRGSGYYQYDVQTKTNLRSGRIFITFTAPESMGGNDVFAFRAPRYASQQTCTFTVANAQLEMGSTAHDYEPYSASTTALLPSTAAPLRSLPDGTHDELSVARDGTVSVIRRVASVTMNGTENIGADGNSSAGIPRWHWYTALGSAEVAGFRVRSTHFSPYSSWQSMPDGTFYVGPNSIVFASSLFTDTATTKAWLAANLPEFIYQLATPTTETLPSVTMPTVPSRNLTAWVDATDADGAAIAAPWEMVYERDVTYVIEQLEQAIADI